MELHISQLHYCNIMGEMMSDDIGTKILNEQVDAGVYTSKKKDKTKEKEPNTTKET